MDRDVALIAPLNRVSPGHVFKIGGILVKCCTACGVTRELERFWSDRMCSGGVRDACGICSYKAEKARKQKARQ